jgi:hypothetical protein
LAPVQLALKRKSLGWENQSHLWVEGRKGLGFGLRVHEGFHSDSDRRQLIACQQILNTWTSAHEAAFLFKSAFQSQMERPSIARQDAFQLQMEVPFRRYLSSTRESAFQL